MIEYQLSSMGQSVAFLLIVGAILYFATRN